MPALREFLLIVALGLAALAGQAWWESHQERGREQPYLLRVVEELVADSTEILPGVETKFQALATATDYVSGVTPRFPTRLR